MSLSNLAQQQILRQRMHAMFPYLIRITFPTQGSFFYANTDNDVVYNGFTYKACCFSIVPPDKTESRIGDSQLSFSSIFNDSEWIKKIRNIALSERGEIEVIGAIIYTADNVVDGIEPIFDTEFTLADVSWDEENIKWTMRYVDGMDIVMPCDTLDELVCPGIA